MNIIVADDDRVARQRLVQLIEESPEYSVVGEAATGLEAIGLVTDTDADLILMDIDMPDLNGVNAASHLRRVSPEISIIFVTAYEEHAVKAFELEAVDYVMKPVTMERLSAALGRVAVKRFSSGASSYAAKGSQLCVRSKDEMYLLEFEDIVFIKAQAGGIMLRCAGADYVMDGTLKGFENAFPDKFMRIHRNALVAPHHISGLKRGDQGQWTVQFKGDDARMEVSRRHVSELRKWMKRRAVTT